MHYFPWNPKAYALATSHLSNEEDICYRRALDLCYDTELPIPVETQSVSRRLRVAPETLDTILKEYFTLTPDGWVNSKAAEEIAKYQQKCQTNQQNGKQGGRKKKARSKTRTNPVGSQSLPNASPSAAEGQGNKEPVTNNKEPSFTPQPPRGMALSAPNQLELLNPVSTEAESNPPPAKKEKGPEKRQRREVLEALVSEGGHRDLSKVTRPVWVEAATALKIIREVEGDDLTVQLIHAVANAYRREWPQMSLTPSALAKHWATFRPQQKKEGQAPAGKYGVPPCHDWPQFCRDHFGWENLPPWPELDLNRRRQVHLAFEQSPQPT